MADHDVYWREWLDTWHKLSDPHGPAFKDEYSAIHVFSTLRNDENAIRACLRDYPCGEALGDRIMEIFAATSWGEENPQPSQSYYLLVQNPYPATDTELIDWATHYLERARELAGAIDEIPSVKVVRCDDPENEATSYDEWGEIDIDLADWVAGFLPDRMDKRTQAAYYLITEPLYRLACTYDLVYFAEWAFAEGIIRGTNPYRAKFNLWRSSVHLGFSDPDQAVIYAPTLGKKVSPPPPLLEEELVGVPGPDDEWRPKPDCNVPQQDGFRFYEQKRAYSDRNAMRPAQSDLRGFDRDFGCRGLPITEWDPDIHFVMERTRQRDILGTPMGWPLVSDRFKTIMEEAAITGVTFHPLKVTHESGEELPKYWFMNVLGIANALDRSQHPTYRTYLWRREEEVERTAEFTIRQEVVGDRDLFRALEDAKGVPNPNRWLGPDLPKPEVHIPYEIFVSARYRDLCIKHKCTGIEFDVHIAS